jgi:hypothetical protein
VVSRKNPVSLQNKTRDWHNLPNTLYLKELSDCFIPTELIPEMSRILVIQAMDEERSRYLQAEAYE